MLRSVWRSQGRRATSAFRNASTTRQVIGIDLGTTNSAVAVMEGQTPKILEDSEGRRTTPSTVAFTKEGGVLVGEAAKRQSILNHENTFYATKRLMGRKFSDEEVRRDVKVSPYRISEHENGDAWLETTYGMKYSPSQIGGYVLAEMKRIAEGGLGADVRNAVVTVPAYFNDAQRQATKVAGDIAGLKVLRVVNEPTAASLAYGLDKQKDGIVAVYDLGGGTFDISILDIEDGVFEVRSTNGDTHLGGEDFDHILVNYILDSFEVGTGKDLRKDRLAIQRIRQAAEKAKIELSHVKTTRIELPFITDSDNISLELTEDQLDDMSLHLIQRTITPLKKAIKDADLEVTDIDEVILVGGMTRMPKIRKTVQDFFKKAPSVAVNPDEAVALGAAIQGAVLSGEVKDVLLLDVTPLTLGIETYGGIFSPLIPRNTTVPCKIQQLYSTAVDGQNAIDINVYQGERPLVQDNKLIGNFKLTGIPPEAKGIPKIKVSFDIDADGIIKVSATDDSGKESSITVQGATGLTEEEVARMVEESKNLSEQDKIRKEVLTAANNLELICFDTEQAIEQFKKLIDEASLTNLLSKVKEMRALVEEARNGDFADISVLNTGQEQLKAEALVVMEKVIAASREKKV
ncbi:unnamed protein product [Kuraishia capsulata CBS 1993]|uniref:Iron-sulfur cluster biogenesis chaperone, mitochondrial n=1 Tax=Kuraishia capsulata CBS 1993 TaxID=1382522 RepID=W6MY00_9ASCO|nr:uncharacterized protein KUCA_T00005763001 [Kuraishia capsulata CBS 1993]CDK29770.1 unnamed protein product [Kuraishia capsulata CBS 1993]